jgi:hypothetical protein
VKAYLKRSERDAPEPNGCWSLPELAEFDKVVAKSQRNYYVMGEPPEMLQRAGSRLREIQQP